MALTASRIMQRAYRELGMLTDIIATGGAVGSIIDTNSRFTADNAMLNGTAFVVLDAGGAGAAPQGEYRTISGYTASTETFTVGTDFTVAVASGDYIGLARSTIPALQMFQALQDGLQDLGYIDLIDTSITTAAEQDEYTLPVGLKYDEPVDVLMQGTTSDSNANLYESIRQYVKIFPAAPGSTGILEARDLAAGYLLKIIYRGTHPMLTVHSSVISETIPEGLAVAATIDKALDWLNTKRAGSIQPFMVQRWNAAKQSLAEKKIVLPKTNQHKKSKWFVLEDA